MHSAITGELNLSATNIPTRVRTHNRTNCTHIFSYAVARYYLLFFPDKHNSTANQAQQTYLSSIVRQRNSLERNCRFLQICALKHHAKYNGSFTSAYPSMATRSTHCNRKNVNINRRYFSKRVTCALAFYNPVTSLYWKNPGSSEIVIPSYIQKTPTCTKFSECKQAKV